MYYELCFSFTMYNKKYVSDLSTLTVLLCVTRFHCLSHVLTVCSSFLKLLQILIGFSLKITVFEENNQRQHNLLSKNVVAWSST